MRRILPVVLFLTFGVLFLHADVCMAMGKKPSLPPRTVDPLTDAIYPKYRIDHMLKKICILGSGEGKSQIDDYLNNFFLYLGNVTIVDPTNLQSIFGGKIIEYGTGFSADESKAIAQLLQVDHIVLYEEIISNHQDYKIGGRCEVQIALKIINTRNGEIVFTALGRFGSNYYDPRPYGYMYWEPVLDVDKRFFRNAILGYYISFPLSIAMGCGQDGFSWDGNSTKIIGILRGSPADKAGLKIGDKILSINDKILKYSNDLSTFYAFQSGNITRLEQTRKFLIERNGVQSIVNVSYPSIPFYPNVPLEKQEEDSVDSPDKLKIKKAI